MIRIDLYLKILFNKMIWCCCFPTKETQKPDVRKLDREIKEKLCPFIISNVEGLCEVKRVIDGDTYELYVYLALEDLSREVVHGRNHEKKQPIYTEYKEAGFYTVLTCRVNGIDVAEHDTYHGQYATEEFKKIMNQYNNILYYRIHENFGKKGQKLQDSREKSGRILFDLYFDSEYKHNINDFFYSLRYKGEKVALPYDGKTKDDYLKNLPKIQK